GGEDADDLATKLRVGVDGYSAWYREYYERNMTDESRAFAIDPAGPRVVIIPGVGIVTSGSDAGQARFSRDLYRRAIAVESAAVVADEIVATHGLRRALHVPVDVRDERAVDAMVRQTVLEWGGIDIVVCSAGIATAAPVTETSLADWNRNHEILARGYFLVAR